MAKDKKNTRYAEMRVAMFFESVRQTQIKFVEDILKQWSVSNIDTL